MAAAPPLRRRLPSLAALLLCVLSGGRAAARTGPVPTPGARSPSVLLITLDTTRADRLGCYGSRAGLTPFLDGLAKRSTLFERCYSPVPLTLPSHTSILSGWLPGRHGVRENAGEGVPRDVPVLAAAFREKGYATGAFVSASILLKRYGLDRGFDTYDDTFYDRTSRSYQKAAAAVTLPKALDWIRARREPFFCWVHLFDPHRPYAGFEPYASRYRDRPYDGEVAYMDAQIAAFWGELSRSIRTEDLLLVVCADHGEALGEHGEEEHGIFLYEDTVRVPLLIRVPGQIEPRRVPAPVGLVDIAPTLRELAALPPVAPSDGASLTPLLQGGPREPRPLVLESLEGMHCFGWAPLYAVVAGGEKFIQAPHPELYDLAADPGEAVNLAAQRPARAGALGAVLEANRSALPDRTPAHPEGPKDREELRQLTSLGYLGGTGGTAPTSGRDPKEMISLRTPILEAAVLLEARKHREALDRLTPLLAKDPDNPYLHFLLGQAYRPTEPSRAAAAWKRAVALAPTFSMAWDEWVLLLLDSNRPADAARVAAVGLASCQDRAGWLHVALAYEAARAGGRPQEVVAQASRALEANPDLAMAYVLRAGALRSEGETASVENDLRTARSLATPDEIARWKRNPVLGGTLGTPSAAEPAARPPR